MRLLLRPHPCAALVLGLALAACSGKGEAPAGTLVVLISIDTLRSDRLPAYGYTGVETPAIDALRRDSILYERAYSHVPLTLPSHVSLLSGQLPTVHGVRDNAGYRVPAAGPWLPAALQERGYATGGVVSAYVLRGVTGLSRGFDFYEDGITFRPGSAMGGLSRSGGESLRLALGWLRSLGSPGAAGTAGATETSGSGSGKPFFLFFHLYEPHAPYQPPAPFAARYAASPYDGEVAEADRVVGELMAGLKELGVYDRALIVLLSDHGEGLGEHGEDEHGIFVYRESLQVPLLVKLPGGARAGTSVAAPVQLADVYPTVVEIAGLPLPEGLPGTALTAFGAGSSGASDSTPRRIYAESYYPRFHYGWSELLTLIDGRHQYIQAPEPELYDLVADPAGHANRLLADRRTAGTLRQALTAEVREPAPPSAVDAETRQSLAALGYAAGGSGGGPGGPGADLPDPKRRIQTLAGMRIAFGHFRESHFAEAVPAFERALAENPRMLDGWDYFGRALQHLGRFREAQAAYEKALEISGGDPDYALAVAAVQLEQGQIERALATIRWARSAGQPSPDVLRQLGLRLAEMGQATAAVEILDSPPEAGPGATAPADAAQLAALGLALSAAGRQEEARDRLLQAVALDAGNAAAQENLGLVMLRLGRFPEARDSSRRAVEIDPGRANAWNNLGVALYQTGDRDGALAAWARAVEIDPRQFDTLYNLGIKAAEAGRLDQARWALRQFAATAPPERYAADLPRVREMLRQLDGQGR